MAKYKTIFIFFFIIKILFKIQNLLKNMKTKKKMIFGVSEIFEKFFNTQPKRFKKFFKRKFPVLFLHHLINSFNLSFNFDVANQGIGEVFELTSTVYTDIAR